MQGLCAEAVCRGWQRLEEAVWARARALRELVEFVWARAAAGSMRVMK